MELQYFGGNCLAITTKSVRLVIDDNLAALGAKSPSRPGDVAIFSGPHSAPATEPKLLIDTPGEYEVGDISIVGVAARAHMDEADTRRATMYKFTGPEFSILVTGHIYPELSEAQLEQIGIVDVVVAPVGGNGYTLDATGALRVIKAIEPKLVIPTHFAAKGFNYEVPQATLESALQSMSMEVKETVPKLKLKPADLSDNLQLLVLEISGL